MDFYVVFTGTLLLLSMFGSSSDGFNADELDEEKATAMFNCISTIVCKLHDGHKLIVIAEAAGDEMREWGMKCMMGKYNITLPMKMDEYFKEYSPQVCQFEYEVRKNAFKAFMLDVTKKMETMCKDPSKKDECEKCMKAIEAGEELIREHTESGDCHNPKDFAEDAIAEDKEKFEQAASGMKPPNFG